MMEHALESMVVPIAATNYDVACIDDGSCSILLHVTLLRNECIFDQIIHDRATFNWDNMNTSTCE